MFPPCLLYVRCKSGVTFIRRRFRDGYCLVFHEMYCEMLVKTNEVWFLPVFNKFPYTTNNHDKYFFIMFQIKASQYPFIAIAVSINAFYVQA